MAGRMKEKGISTMFLLIKYETTLYILEFSSLRKTDRSVGNTRAMGIMD
jgi:hypothetical protein